MSDASLTAGASCAVLFDLDGTLIDSVDLICRSWRHALAKFGLGQLPDSSFLSQMGRPLEGVMHDLLGGESQVAQMAACYREYQHLVHDRYLRVYDGVHTAIQHLAKTEMQLGVVTSKPVAIARRGLEFASLEGFFSVVIGADSVSRHKPEPDPVLAGLAALGIDATKAAYVGDAPVDVLAGNAAGTRTVACLWGPFSRADFSACSPDHIIEHPDELSILFR